jgi:predicted acylesterase/phospholipase RssA
VAGAYFAAFAGTSAGGWGSAGLAKLVGDRGKLSDVAAKAMFRSGFMRDAIDSATGGQRLESLVVPFFPMGSNLDDGTQWAIYRGTLGEGVVGSSAFPMIYPAAEIGGTRYLDGCMISNVPDEVLRAEGADLLIASNVCADPCATESVKVEDFGRLVRLAGRVLPVQRVLDAWRGVQMLLHEMSVYNASRSEFLFQPDPVPWFFWDMEEGYRIAMQSVPQAREVADQIEVRWRRMSRQRHDEPPRMTGGGPFGMRPRGHEETRD